VLIMAGTNDLGMGYDSGIVVDNVKALHCLCHDQNVPTVAMSLPPNVGCERSPEYMRLWSDVNEALHKWSEAISKVTLFVDTGTLIPLDTKGHFYSLDRLHLSPEGVESLGQGVADLLAPILRGGVRTLESDEVSKCCVQSLEVSRSTPYLSNRSWLWLSLGIMFCIHEYIRPCASVGIRSLVGFRSVFHWTRH